MEFNAESSTVFGGLTEVQDAVSAGLNYVSEGFRNFMVHLIPQVKVLIGQKQSRLGGK
nr:hypothetical protein [Streptococcus agalactiae]